MNDPNPDVADIRPLETRYAGCRFRSRLEARWAVFFDQLAIPWDYEPEGWLTDGAPYLPDFYLPVQNAWYEVKGKPPLEGYADRVSGLAVGSKRRLMVAVGSIPRPDAYRVAAAGDGQPFYMEVCYPDGSWDAPYAWCRCNACGATDVQFEGRAERNCKCYGEAEDWLWSGPYHRDILAAYAAARSARFEHGEVG